MWAGEGVKGSLNEAPKKPQTHRVKLLRGYLKQTIHLLALFAFSCARRGRRWRTRAVMKSSARGTLSAPAQHGYMSQLNKYGCMLSSSTWLESQSPAVWSCLTRPALRSSIPWKKVQLMKSIELQPDQEVGQDGCNFRLMKSWRWEQILFA